MTQSFARIRSRMLVVSSIVLLLWSGLSLRFFFIQVIQADTLRQQEQRQSQSRVVLPAVRGSIFDRHGRAFAENLIHYDVAIDPGRVRDRKAIVRALCASTGRSASAYLPKFSRRTSFEYLERNVRHDAANPILRLKDPGLVISRRGYRAYPHGNVSSQVVGMTNTDNAGLSGMELQLDRQLKGEDGWIVLEADGKGRTSRSVGLPVQRPADGHNAFLTIDLNYQSILRDELLKRKEEIGAQGAMGVVIEPFSGRILAMCSLPDFDPNARTVYPEETYKNRVITDQFEPGSTFKVVTATAVLDRKTVPLDKTFHCGDGQILYNGRVIKDWSKFGILTFPEIIQNSSNVGTIHLAQTIGSEGLYRQARKYGFGAITGVEFAGEVEGKLKAVDTWSGISLAEMSLGHEVSVTALQLAYAYGAIANGGFLMAPVLLDRIEDSEGKVVHRSVPQVVRRAASAEVMATLTDMLTAVISRGTGTAARLEGWDVAGKTGTAQKYVDGSYSLRHFTASFAGFFPASNPQVVAVIVFDEPRVGSHFGSVAAAPVFTRVMKRIIAAGDEFLVRAPAPDPPADIASGSQTPQKISTDPPQLMLSTVRPAAATPGRTIIVPDVRGWSRRSAIGHLRNVGLEPQVTGLGAVVTQSLLPGSAVARGSSCTLTLR